MKFLVMLYPKESFTAQPYSVQRQVITSEIECLNRQREQGIITELYLTHEQNTGCSVAIYQCQSYDELWKYENEIPGINFFHVKVNPLLDFNSALEVATKNMENADFMPGGTVK